MSVRRGGRSLFLIELFLALLFFSLAAAICVRLFVGARALSRDAADMSRAAIESQSIAECFKAVAGELDEAARLLGVPPGDGALEVRFDGDWHRAEGAGAFLASLTASPEENGLRRALLQVCRSRDGRVLIEFEVAAAEAAA